MLFSYLDPFTMSLLFQILAMGFMTTLIFVKKIKRFFFGLFGMKEKTESLETEEDKSEVIHSIASDHEVDVQEKKAA